MKTTNILAIGAILLVALSCQQVQQGMRQEPSGGTAGCDLFFNNWNTAAVQNGAKKPRFKLGPQDPSELCAVATYHWNGGNGKAPGTISLVNKTTGVTYGPWQAVGTAGQGGAKNVNWLVELNPRIELKPGNYEVDDSDLLSWSWNARSKDKGQPPRAAGFAKVWLANAR